MVVIQINPTQKWPQQQLVDFLHPPIYQALIGSFSKCPCPLKSWENRQALQCCPEGQTLGPGRETTLLSSSPFLSSSSAFTLGALHLHSTTEFSKDSILHILFLKQMQCHILKVTKMSLGKHWNPLQRVRDIFAIISQTQSVVCCHSPS